MTSLILKRGILSADEWWQGEDYEVLTDGKVIGRIYEDAVASTPPDMRWFWTVTAIVPARSGKTYDHAPTLDEAKAKFRAAWEKAQSAPLTNR